MRRILGIDPGTRITGFGLLQQGPRALQHIENGLITLRPTLPMPERLSHLYTELKKILDRFQPDVVAIEDLFVAKNSRSSLKLGYARGVAMLAAAESGIPVSEYPPAQVKQTVANFGHAGKEQIQKMVKLHLKLPEVAQEDASDALAVALCHAQSCRWNEKIA